MATLSHLTRHAASALRAILRGLSIAAMGLTIPAVALGASPFGVFESAEPDAASARDRLVWPPPRFEFVGTEVTEWWTPGHAATARPAKCGFLRIQSVFSYRGGDDTFWNRAGFGIGLGSIRTAAPAAETVGEWRELSLSYRMSLDFKIAYTRRVSEVGTTLGSQEVASDMIGIAWGLRLPGLALIIVNPSVGESRATSSVSGAIVDGFTWRVDLLFVIPAIGLFAPLVSVGGIGSESFASFGLSLCVPVF